MFSRTLKVRVECWRKAAAGFSQRENKIIIYSEGEKKGKEKVGGVTRRRNQSARSDGAKHESVGSNPSASFM